MKARKLICGFIAALSMFATCAPSAHAVTKVPGTPFVIASTREVDKVLDNMNPKIIYIEKIRGVVDDSKSGDGHNIDVPEYYISYRGMKYKKKKLPKGARVTTFCILDNDNPAHETLLRIDIYKGVIRIK